jgi:heparan-alpha-glucosaminide N-acetyltransferase
MNGARLRSIDIFRALTMFLMIFVNDLWTLHGIPDWLGHKAAGEDGMGLADVVFPAFLFIVGLSIPHAVRSRLGRGQSKWQIGRHIAERTLALLIMGLMMVNLESLKAASMPVNRQWWEILMTFGFFLIWNGYREKGPGGISPLVFKLTGWALLIFLSAIFRNSGAGDYQWMRIHWWGILGLIGWGYLLNALIYLTLGNRPGWMAMIFLLLLLLNVNEFISPFPEGIRIVVSASNHASVMCGMLVSTVLFRLEESERPHYFIPFLLLLAGILMAAGFLSRPLWGISKIRATPSWTMICASISLLSFGLLHQLADRMKLSGWARVFSPAGSATLTCYLVPYILYPLAGMTGILLPGIITSGILGILKSILFSLLVIQLTGLLGRWGIRLKI